MSCPIALRLNRCLASSFAPVRTITDFFVSLHPPACIKAFQSKLLALRSGILSFPKSIEEGVRELTCLDKFNKLHQELSKILWNAKAQKESLWETSARSLVQCLDVSLKSGDLFKIPVFCCLSCCSFCSTMRSTSSFKDGMRRLLASKSLPGSCCKIDANEWCHFSDKANRG